MRTYSEGMKLRLAFGMVAVRRPALLVLDEVLAVGDVGFRRKCEERIAEMREQGTSLVLLNDIKTSMRAPGFASRLGSPIEISFSVIVTKRHPDGRACKRCADPVS